MTSPPTNTSARVQKMQADAAKKALRQRLAIAGGAIGIIVVLVVVLILVRVVGGGSDKTSGKAVTSGAGVITGVTHVPVSALNAVGAGTASIPPKPIQGAPALTEGGKPKVLFVGADFCPYCAATRWGLVVALSRFGTFSNLGQTSSSSTDVYPDTATLTFHGATYTSDVIVFKGYETRDRNSQPLDTPAPDDQATFEKFDGPPLVAAAQAGSIPFIDFGGKYATVGADFDPATLKGLTQAQIVADLSNPASPVAQAILGQANQMTAAICTLTDQQPAAVCSSAGVKAGATKLTSAG